MSADGDDAVVAAGAFPALLPWQREAARALLARRSAWPHALLLHGPRGIGKEVLALNLSRALLCESPPRDEAACGDCPGCRYVAAGQHPDLRRIEPIEVDDDGEIKRLSAIPVAHIRGLIEFAHVTSHRRVAKVALIVPAEAMNAEAANALLKTLEEPPAGMYLILVSHQPARLPATVRSRCAFIDAPRPTRQQGEDWLAAQRVADGATLLAQADGAPLAARMLAVPELQSERSLWLKALSRPEMLSAVALAARIDAVGRDERRDRLAAAHEWLLAWTFDLARAAAGGTPVRNPDFGAAIAALANRVARISLCRYHGSLLRRRALLAHPLQPRLVAESALLEYRTLFNQRL
jgi:DNA polymerase-3 subunit delta'